MAKFCGNCGAELPEGARVCGQCGTPVDGAGGGNVPGVKIVDPQQAEKQKKLFKKILCAVVAVFVLIAAIRIVPNFIGYKGAVRKVMKAYVKYDIDSMVDMSSDVYYYSLGELGSDAAQYYFEDAVGQTMDDFEDDVGPNYKITYEIEETYLMSQRQLDQLMTQLESSYSGFDADLIEKIAAAQIKVTATEGKKSSSKEITVSVSKENGKWRLLLIQ